MPRPPRARTPTLSQRAVDLRNTLGSDAVIRIERGRLLRCRFSLAPSEFGRFYECELRLRPDGRRPEMFVVSPNLYELAEGRPLPHIYSSDSAGVKLCLWFPGSGEWRPQMLVSQTYIPWTARWLFYFEEWLSSDEWKGGGVHP